MAMLKIGQLIKQKRKYEKFTMRGLAKLCNLSAAYISDLENDKLASPPTIKTFKKIVAVLNFNLEEKEQLIRSLALERTPDLIKKELNFYKSSHFKNLEKSNLSKLSIYEEEEFKSIPVFESISAGRGQLSNEQATDNLFIPGLNRMNNVFAIKVNGNSMEPKIPDGSVIVVKTDEYPSNNQIGAFLYGEELYVKIYDDSFGETRLLSSNKEYSDILVDTSEHFKILGKVIKIIINI